MGLFLKRNLIASVFSNPLKIKEIVKLLYKNNLGLTRKELIANLNIYVSLNFILVNIL